ncbi:MAG: hypothetical protein JWP08_3696 [Bryobacterales bacterium]|nr:hypothetical protein [Bryobacterales bacterium]
MSEGTEFPIPPADFSFLVQSILMQTQMQLGLLHFGEEDELVEEPNLALARHSIDLLSMLQAKTKGNLTVEEQRLLENGLTELRFRYVQVADEQKKKSEPQLAQPSEDEGPRIITSDGGKGTKTS